MTSLIIKSFKLFSKLFYIRHHQSSYDKSIIIFPADPLWGHDPITEQLPFGVHTDFRPNNKWKPKLGQCPLQSGVPSVKELSVFST